MLISYALCNRESDLPGRTGRGSFLTMLVGFFVLFFASFGFADSAASDSAFFGEYEIKAGFIYRFLSFVSWPADSVSDTITIGIVGSNPFGDAFSAVEGTTVGHQVVKVSYFDNIKDHETLRKCQILFISGDVPDRDVQQLLGMFAGSPTLTVGESPGFIDKGGMIGFTRRDRRRIGIEINVSATERSGLTVRSMLMRIAVRMIKDQ